jgi:hypothetical protein
MISKENKRRTKLAYIEQKLDEHIINLQNKTNMKILGEETMKKN